MSNGKHPEHLKLEAVIKRHIARHERSLQTRIGASEIGTPCDRRLALKLAEVKEINVNPSADWRPTVGVAVHEWLARAFAVENKRNHTAYRIEEKLAVGTLAPMVTLPGGYDIYDPEWPGIVDWKIVGVTTLRRVRSYGVGPGYRTQQHLYGRGVAHLGQPVENVACYFLPNNGVLDDAYFWTEPYDPGYADAQLKRARAIYAAVEHEPEMAATFPTTFDNCGYCPYFDPLSGEHELLKCAGDPEMHTRDSTLDGLI